MEIIFKPTHQCNGNCAYCSAAAHAQESMVFPREALGRLFERLRAWLEMDARNNLRFVWHGGEPLICGIDYYKAVIEEQYRAFPSDLWRVKNTVQSNLTLVTEAWAPVLRELVRDQSIGTSYDFIEGVRGLANGDSLAERWLAGLDIVHAQGIPIGVVYTVHKKSRERAHDLYYFFRNLGKISNIRFNALYRQGAATSEDAASLHVTPEEYGAFLLALYEVWKQDGWHFAVAPLVEWMNAWRDDTKPLSCDSLGRCHVTHLALNPDGRVFHCGRVSDEGLTPFGHILDDPLEMILGHEQRRALAERGARLRQAQCAGCRFWRVCHGGCPMMGWIAYGDLFRETHLCAANKMVFEHLEREWGPLAADTTDLPAA